MTAALIGAAIVYLIASPTAALLLGGITKLRDTQTPGTAVMGEASRRPGASHLRPVP